MKKLSISLILLVLVGLSGSSFGEARGPRSIREGQSHDERLSPILSQVLPTWRGAAIPVIVRVREDVFQRDRQNRELGGHSMRNMLESINSYTASLRPDQIRLLLQSDAVEYIATDPVIRPTYAARDHDNDKGKKNKGKSQGKKELRDFRKLTGAEYTGVKGDAVVAVFDSGIGGHDDLPNPKVRMDFTAGYGMKEESPDDSYGHGTHVTGIISGSGSDSGGRQKGISESDVVDIKVITDDGWGTTSNLIKAIDWVIANKDKYKIRVANFSLGHPPYESYRDDPLCAAVRRMVAAGIVTVVSAGNLGRTDQEPYIFGGITSPGIEPSVITVGAINNNETLTHRDDVATTYSSRGPTIDGLVKPDLVAPGNGIPSTVIAGSYLERNYPDLKLNDAYLELSGSSMATAFVSGAVSQMLDKNDSLTPHLVKMILMLTATKLDLPHLFEQGHGMINIKAAVDMAKQIHTKKRELKKDIDPYWLLPLSGEKCKKPGRECEAVWAGGAVIIGDHVLFSPMVINPTTDLWGDSFDWAGNLEWNPKSKDSWGKGFFKSESFLWSDAFIWSDALQMVDTALDPTVLAVDGFLWADGFLWSDAFLWADANVSGSSSGVVPDYNRGDP